MLIWIALFLAVCSTSEARSYDPCDCGRPKWGVRGEYAHAAEIQDRLTGRIIGGGTIITPKNIITPASVVNYYRKKDLKVGVGLDTRACDWYDLEMIIIHKYYSEITGENDLAVLQTCDPIVFSDYVGVACLLFNFSAPVPIYAGVEQVNKENRRNYNGTSDVTSDVLCTTGEKLCTNTGWIGGRREKPRQDGCSLFKGSLITYADAKNPPGKYGVGMVTKNHCDPKGTSTGDNTFLGDDSVAWICRKIVAGSRLCSAHDLVLHKTGA